MRTIRVYKVYDEVKHVLVINYLISLTYLLFDLNEILIIFNSTHITRSIIDLSMIIENLIFLYNAILSSSGRLKRIPKIHISFHQNIDQKLLEY